MNESSLSERACAQETTLLLCDAAGRVQAVSSGANDEAIFSASARHKHFAEVFGPDSNLTLWLTDHINEGRKRGAYIAESRLENGDSQLHVRVESLRNDDELYGFAVYLSGGEQDHAPLALDEGDAIVTRQQWHDIKNHLGGLKLYATFLKRKLGAGDDQQIVEKMLHGIDVLIEHLAKIRRGEAQ